MDWFKDQISEKKRFLEQQISGPMELVSVECSLVWRDPQALDELLQKALRSMPVARMIYAVNSDCQQISANISQRGIDDEPRGQVLGHRPYMTARLPYRGMVLSSPYISRSDREPCITAVQAVLIDNSLVGLLLVDFTLRSLGLEENAQSAGIWKQYKGDPSIRGQLFQQQRIESFLDQVIDQCHESAFTLMHKYGVFHCKFHYSSSRVTLWFYDDPYRYRIHSAQELIDPDMWLAYPVTQYPKQAVVAEDDIMRVFEQFKKLRSADENIYLRSGSLNMINGMVGLTFSCDGSHYIPVQEFLDQSSPFWFGENRIIA